MLLTTITVRYGRTHNLGDYSNIRPEVELVAELEENDNLEVAKAKLFAEAKAVVEEEIDLALEAQDRPAQFSREPRYQVIYTSESVWAVERERGRDQRVEAPERLIIILPNDLTIDREPAAGGTTWWTHVHDGRRLRLAHARRKAEEWGAERGTFRRIDCADGDLSRVPAWVFAAPADLIPRPEPEPAGPAIVFDEPEDASYDRYVAGRDE